MNAHLAGPPKNDDDLYTRGQRVVHSISRKHRLDSKPITTLVAPEVQPFQMQGFGIAKQTLRTSFLSSDLVAFERDFQLERKLGAGGFGDVHLATRRLDGRQVAVKELRVDAGAGKDKLAALKSEVAIMRACEHPCLLHLFAVFWARDNSKVLLAVQYAPGGTLFEWIERVERQGLRETGGPSTLPEVHQRRIARDLLSGLSHMHSRGVMHRDVKPENILFLNDSLKAPLVLGDFGLARSCPPSPVKRSSQPAGQQPPPLPPPLPPPPPKGRPRGQPRRLARDLNAEGGAGDGRGNGDGGEEEKGAAPRLRRRKTTRSFAGTPDWMAPEVIMCLSDEGDWSGYAYSCDVWSAGCVLLAVLGGIQESPFRYGRREIDEVFTAILEAECRLALGRVASPQALDLVEQMLTLRPVERIRDATTPCTCTCEGVDVDVITLHPTSTLRRG